MEIINKEVLEKIIPTVYEDTLQPSSQEIGITLKKVVEIVCSPINMSYGGYEILKEFFQGVQTKLKERALFIEKNFELKMPQTGFTQNLIRNTIEAGEEDNIRDLFENLLVNEMCLTDTDKDAPHPDFANIIGRMSSEEAKLFIYIGKRSSMLLEIEIQDSEKVSDEWLFKNFSHFDRLETLGLVSSYDRVKEEKLRLTPFGLSLFRAVFDKSLYSKLFSRARRMKRYLQIKNTKSNDKGEIE